MKHTRKHRLHLPFAFLLSLFLIFEGLSVVAFAADSDDTTVGTEVDTGMLVPDLPDAEDEELESDVIISPPSISVGDREQASTTATTATQAILDGIYALRNAGNTGLYMDTQYDASSPGYKLQQYAYSQTPVKTLAEGGFANGGVFKVSYRSDLGTYVIRSMTNNLLSYKFSGNYVVTHEIPAEDTEVAAADTFTITRGASGYFISPYGSSYCIAAKATTASGSAGAPDSYLIKSTQTASGKQAQWLFANYSYYTTEHKQGYLMQQEPTAEDLVAGNTCTFKVKTWSTKINHNVPYLRLFTSNGSDYTFNWQTNTLSVSLYEEGRIVLGIEAREHDLTRNLIATRSYNVILPVASGTYLFMNRQVEQYMHNNSNNDDDTPVDVSSLTDGYYNKWIIEHYGGKYYTIKSDRMNLYLTVPSGSYDSNNVKLQLEEYTGDSGQLWRFEKPHEDIDSYVIRPRSSEGQTTDWCINVKDTLLGWDDGAIVQGDFQDNTSYLDEWMLYTFDTAILLAFDDYIDKASRDEYFANTMEIMQTPTNGKVSIVTSEKYGSVTDDEMVDYLQNSDIFIIHTHGDKTSFQIANSGTETITMSDIKYEDLSNISFALLLTCEGGLNYDLAHITNNAPVNIVEQMVLSGAETVIGFKVKPTVTFCNNFAPDLMKTLIYEGLSVDDAIKNLKNQAYYKDLLDMVVIAGNGDNKLR